MLFLVFIMDNLSRYTYYLQSIADVLALIVSFFISMGLKELIRFGIKVPSYAPYVNVIIVTIIGYAIANIIFLSREDMLRRKFSGEIVSALKTVAFTFIVLVIYLYTTKNGENYSRIFTGIYAIVSFFLILIFRTLMKKWVLPLFQKGKSAEKVIVVGTEEEIREAAQRISRSHDWRIQITGAALIDQEGKEYVDQIPVISGKENLYQNLSEASADSLLVVSDARAKDLNQLIRKLIETGKTVHVGISEFNIVKDANRYVDEIGGEAVVSYIPFVKMPKRYAFFKRILDVALSLLLLPLYFVFYILTWIFNGLESKGPVLENMIRVGKNGRRLYKKKFRVLRMDAEERIRQGKRPFTIWGKFLATTHLNGLPELVNILSGDMSFCGPHAPTIERYLAYHPERRKNLCILPGVFGEWTVESDEEYIIARERDYIKNWSLFRDLLIYMEVFFKYITFHSSRKYDEKALKEDIQLIHDYKVDHQPMPYDHSAYVHQPSFREYVYLFFKRVLDIVLSLAGIILLSPLLLILCIAVMADDGGSPIYRHERIGYHGKKIYIAKFRSMRTDSGDLRRLLSPQQLEQYETEFKVDDDPRITRIGSFIRRTSLDELPQLFNILGGSLSIVGPRPVVQKETEIYGKDVARLLSVKPGLTGYWQAYARNNATYETGERQAMEMYYVDHRSMWLDIKIFFKTFSSVAREEGAK